MTKKELIQFKKLSFWGWISKSEQSEGGHSINLDKRIPGFASLIAILIFFAKQFIEHENEEVEIFTDLNFTIALQLFNVIVLIIMLIRGLRITQENINSEKNGNDVEINNKYIGSLERQFIGFLKYFLFMTLCLYLALIINTSFSGKEYNGIKKNDWLANIRNGRNDIKKGIRLLTCNILNDGIDSTKTNLTGDSLTNLFTQLQAMDEPLKQIIFDDSIERLDKSVKFSYLQRIQNSNKRVGEIALDIHNNISQNPSNDSAINLIYKGHLTIERNSHELDTESKRIVLTDIIEVLFSNVGALFLVYCFLVLYTKTIDPNDNGEYEKSILNIKYLFDNQKGYSNTLKILRFLISTLIIVTLMHSVFESYFAGYSRVISTLFTLFSGLCNALALSLLVARFESSLFNSTFSVLVILYLYANIQVLFGVFDIQLINYPHLIEDITFVIAFVGKCFLYLYVLWLLRTDRLKYYFYHKYDNSSATKLKMSWPEFLELVTMPEEQS